MKKSKNFNVLITGISGFTGSHLADYLLGKGCTVFGSLYNKNELRNIEHIIDRIQTIQVDICIPSQVTRMIQTAVPDYIFHLAAESQARGIKNVSKATYKTNLTGTLNLLEAVLRNGINSTVFIPGSSAQFGLVRRNENPIKETNPYRPVSPYAVSKIAQAMIGYQYYLTHGLKIIRTHTFKYIGPRQSQEFACSGFAAQIAQIEKGLKPPVIQVGNMNSWWDFTDVRDVGKGILAGCRKGNTRGGVQYRSGHAYYVRDILEKLLSIIDVKVEVKQDPKRMRPSDVPFQAGDFTKFRSLTGWEPLIPIEESLRDILDYWRGNV